MNYIREPQNDWGGNWTELKLEAFEHYVNAYLSIMNAQKVKYNGWPTTIYFDGFAGSGERNLTSKTKEELNLFSEYLISEEIDIYKGSAERVLSLKQKFDYYYFVDKNNNSLSLLKNKLSEKNLLNNNSYFINDDVNIQLEKLSGIIDRNTALVFLDPFGMQINWESIEKLNNKRVDLWILIPSGVIINRFLDQKCRILFKNKLEKYFGISVEEIKNKFYEIEKVETLFGEIDTVVKTNNAISKISELYIERLKSIFKYVSEKPLILRNTRNIHIYHFVFASNNQTAFKIANQIIEKKN